MTEDYREAALANYTLSTSSLATFPIGEGAASYVLRIERDGSTDDPVYVNLGIAPNAQTASSNDFSFPSSVFIPAGQDFADFTVTFVDDQIFEGTETAFLQMISVVGDQGATFPGSAQFDIVDNDTAPAYSVAVGSVAEGGQATFTITRTVATQADEAVTFKTVTGAAESADFTEIVSQTVNFTGGSLSQTVVVQTTQDARFEGDETFTGIISAPTGSGTIANGTVTATITDDEAAPSYSVSAGAITEGGQVRFTITRTGAQAQGTETVVFNTATGTAGTDDFTAASQTLTFSPGNESRFVDVNTTNDTLFEGNEDFTGTISAPTGGATIGTGTATVTINDNEAAPSYSVAVGAVTEGGQATFTITRTGPASQADETVVFNTAAGTAGAGDFTAISNQTVTFAAGGPGGDVDQTVVVQTTGDLLFEGNENFTGTISSQSAGTIATATAAATITDDEAAPVYSVSAGAITEGGQVRFTITRTGAQSQGSETVVFNTGPDSADANDFTAVTNQTVTFSPGNVERFVDVNTTNDSVFEGNETFTGTISNQSAGTIDSDTATATITENDTAPAYSISVSADVDEGNSGPGNTLTYTVTRTGAMSFGQNVNVTLSGTAGSGDYTTTLVNGQVGFDASTDATESKTFTVTTTPDTVFEANETVVATIGAISGAGTGTGSSAIGTITNDDVAPAYSIAASAATVAEGNTAGNTVTYTVTRTGDTSAAGSVAVATSGTATAGTDYTSSGLTNGRLAFGAGDLTASFTVLTTADTVLESDETVTATISAPHDGANASLGTITTATATTTITNDDIEPVYSITASPPAVNEDAAGSNTITYTVTRTGDISLEGWVSVALSGTATQGTDYTTNLSNGRVTFSQGQNSKTFTVTSTPDSAVEANETVIATISAPVDEGAGAFGTIATAAATATITNDDVAPPAGGGGGTPPITNPGTTGNDTIVGATGNDSLSGGTGNDSVSSGAGNDQVYGNKGLDTLSGGSGSDTVYGGQDNDVVYGGSSGTDSSDAGDELHGNKGDDVVYGNGGDDKIFGGEGSDTAFGGQGNDVMYGGEGQVSTDDGSDLLYGGVGNDVIYGNASNDALFGNQDNDIIFGGQGNDFIHGGQGNDTLQGGVGNDTMNGGVGADQFVFAQGGGNDRIEGFNYGEGDRLNLGGQTYTSSSSNGNTIFTLGDGGTITLIGTDAGSQLF